MSNIWCSAAAASIDGVGGWYKRTALTPILLSCAKPSLVWSALDGVMNDGTIPLMVNGSPLTIKPERPASTTLVETFRRIKQVVSGPLRETDSERLAQPRGHVVSVTNERLSSK